MNKQQRQYVLGASAVSLAAMLWGFDGIVFTPRLYNLQVTYVVFILHLFPFLLMNIFFYREYRKLTQLSANDLLFFFLIALFGGALGTISIVKALFLMNFNKLSIVVLLQKLQPIFAILLAVVLLKEKLGKRFVLWATIAIVSGYVLTFEFKLPDLEASRNTFHASLLALLAAFSFGSSTVFSKMVLRKYDFVTSSFFRYGFTTVLMFLIMLGFGDFGQFHATTRNNWLFIALISFTTGSGTIFLYYYGLKHVKAIMATISELMFPVSAILFDYIFNGSVLSPVQWISAMVMIIAVIRINVEGLEKSSVEESQQLEK